MHAQPNDLADRVALLEAELARLRAPATRPRRRARWKLAVIAMVVALTIPAGVVLADHRFNDVPTGHQFHGAISAIADAGITTGCSQGTNNYCPDGLVTRGQMAAFLSRLGALQAGSAPKVNADRVDGRHANGLTRVASFQTTATTAIAIGATQYGPDLVITAPAAGFVTINYGYTVQTSTCTASCAVSGGVRHVETNTFTTPSEVHVSSTTFRATGSVHRVFPVTAGVNTFELILNRGSTNGTINGWLATGTALFTPFGSTGGSTLGLDGSVDEAVDLEEKERILSGGG